MPPAKAATTGRVNSEERAPRSKDSHSCILYYCEFIHSQIHLHTQMCIANLIECLLLAETDCVTETSAAPRRQQRMSNGNWARKLRMRCRANPRTRSAKSFYYFALNCFLLLSLSFPLWQWQHSCFADCKCEGFAHCISIYMANLFRLALGNGRQTSARLTSLLLSLSLLTRYCSALLKGARHGVVVQLYLLLLSPTRDTKWQKEICQIASVSKFKWTIAKC